MQLTPVTSSNIKAIGHDPEANELHVEFGDGSRWIYAGVDAFRHADMMKAESVGNTSTPTSGGTMRAAGSRARSRW